MFPCQQILQGGHAQIAHELTKLAQPWGTVSATDRQMELARLDTDKASGLLPKGVDPKALRKWWLAFPELRGNTPNFGLASTCEVKCKKGLLLIEAKAHSKELTQCINGKSFDPNEASMDSCRNHHRIGEAIDEANDALMAETKRCWALSRDKRYQMSNRFAWSWKLRELGCPVILVYLSPLPYTEWEQAVKAHSSPLFPAQVWNRPLTGAGGHIFVPCIRSL